MMVRTLRFRLWCWLGAAAFALQILASVCASAAVVTSPNSVAALLTSMNTWILPQPKEVTQLTGSFDLAQCPGIVYVSTETTMSAFAISRLATQLTLRSGVQLSTAYGPAQAGAINLGLFPDGQPPAGFPGITAADLITLAAQGYALHIDSSGVSVAARDQAGLFYGTVTLAQVAADRQALPALQLRDWPSMIYRGVQQDITRGQVPTPATLMTLADVLAEAKMNVMELYIENYFKFPSHPDIAPPESLSAAEGRAIFDHAAPSCLEVHPMFQVFGHSGVILGMTQYQQYAVRQVPDQPWAATFDVRKPAAVAFVNQLVDDVCTAFPGKLINFDITEFDSEGFELSGTPASQIGNLVFNYVLQLNTMVKAHGTQLMVVQEPLESSDTAGAITGLGPNISQLPKDIIVGSYYCAYAIWSTTYQQDYPLLKNAGISFFSQPWIYSHSRLYPWVGAAADFSDAEVKRGLSYGAIGSTTCDWGDEGHYHLVGTEWYPFTYHGAAAWTGASWTNSQTVRAYFNQAFTRIYYGVPNDSVGAAAVLTGNVNGLMLTYKTGTAQSNLFDEFFDDPFSASELTSLADLAATGQAMLTPADQAVSLLQTASALATRNQDNLKQLLFGARNYQAMGNKLLAAGHYNDATYPRDAATSELAASATTMIGLQSDYVNLFLAEDRPNSTFDGFVAKFNNCIVPLFQKSGLSRPYVNTFSQPGDIAGSIIRWGLVGQIVNGQLACSYNSGAIDQPGGSQWGFSPCFFLLVPGLDGDYQEFALKITVKGSPMASIPCTLKSLNSTGYDNSFHRFTLHEGTQLVRFNTLTNVYGSTPWTACGYFMYIELQIPDVAQISGANGQYNAWKNTQFQVDWLSVTKNPHFDPPGTNTAKGWAMFE